MSTVNMRWLWSALTSPPLSLSPAMLGWPASCITTSAARSMPVFPGTLYRMTGTGLASATWHRQSKQTQIQTIGLLYGMPKLHVCCNGYLICFLCTISDCVHCWYLINSRRNRIPFMNAVISDLAEGRAQTLDLLLEK